MDDDDTVDENIEKKIPQKRINTLGTNVYLKIVLIKRGKECVLNSVIWSLFK